MSAENHNFDFDREAGSDVLGAFRGRPARELIGPGGVLYRFTTLGRNQVLGSPWWVPRDSFRRLTTLSSRTGSSLSGGARARLAVTREWNPQMSWLCRVRVLTAVYGWRGVIAHQPLASGSRDVLLIGGGTLH